MRFRAGNSTVDVVVDIDRFELLITSFLPGITADSIESARSLLEPDHMDAARSRLIFAIQSFVLHANGHTILIDSCVGEGKDRASFRNSITANAPASSIAWRKWASRLSR